MFSTHLNHDAFADYVAKAARNVNNRFYYHRRGQVLHPKAHHYPADSARHRKHYQIAAPVTPTNTVRVNYEAKEGLQNPNKVEYRITELELRRIQLQRVLEEKGHRQVGKRSESQTTGYYQYSSPVATETVLRLRLYFFRAGRLIVRVKQVLLGCPSPTFIV